MGLDRALPPIRTRTDVGAAPRGPDAGVVHRRRTAWLILAAAILQVAAGSYSPFIYFRF